MNREDKIFKDYCKQNNISWQDTSLHKIGIQKTMQYQFYVASYSIKEAFEALEKDLLKCVKFAKNKGIIK